MQYTEGVQCTEDVQYTGDITEYTGGYSVHWGDTISTPGGVQYSGDTKMSVGDIMSTLGDAQYTGVSIQVQLFPN